MVNKIEKKKNAKILYINLYTMMTVINNYRLLHAIQISARENKFLNENVTVSFVSFTHTTTSLRSRQ